MNLIKINLLPYRELLEQKQKKDFQTLMLLGALVGLGACALVYMGLAGIIAAQNGRNGTLKSGIAELDTQLAEIQELNKQKQNFLARKQKVEELDNKRFEAARMIDTLNQLVPEGAYLTALSPMGSGNSTAITNNYKIKGKAISDNKVGLFMTALPSTGVFEMLPAPLESITKTDDGQEFILNAELLQQKFPSANDEVKSASSAQGATK